MGRSFSDDSGAGRGPSGARRHFNVSRFAIEHPWTIGIAWLAIAIWGAVAYANLKYSLLPDVALPVVVVTAHEQSIDVAATERDLTIPLERALATSKPTYYTSTTYPGRSVVQLTYGFGNTLRRHEAGVRTILKRTTLPKGSGYSIVPIDLNESAVNVYTVPFTGSDRARVLRDVRDVVIQGPEIHGTFTNGSSFQTYAPNDPTLVSRLYNGKVSITAKPPGDNVPALVSVFPTPRLTLVPELNSPPAWLMKVSRPSRSMP